MPERSAGAPRTVDDPAAPAAAPGGPSRRALFLVGIVVVVALAWFLTSRARTEEDRVREVLDGIEAALEGKDLAGVTSRLSDAYRDADGLGKREVKALLARQFLVDRRPVNVQRVGAVEVVVRGPKKAPTSATVALRARISESGGTVGTALGGEAWDFDVDLAREDGEWRVVRVARKLAP